MRRILLATVAAVAVVGAAIVTTSDIGPGPIPTCNGEQATHVLVAPGTRSDYQAWIDAGVSVQANSDQALVGTEGHDVMVALVETNSGGFVSNPAPAGPLDATAGDFACSFLKHGDDVYYMTKGRGDFIFDAGGSDDYYLGGCELDGAGSPGDRKCDTMIDKGEGGIYDGQFRGSSDSVWTFFVPKGRRTILKEGPAQTHNYAGRGPGKVIIDGGDCFVHINGERVPCQGHVPGNGDHVHPCPVGKTEPDFDLEIKNFGKFRLQDIEYFGDEADLGLAPNDRADPCAYQFSNT